MFWRFYVWCFDLKSNSKSFKIKIIKPLLENEKKRLVLAVRPFYPRAASRPEPYVYISQLVGLTLRVPALRAVIWWALCGRAPMSRRICCERSHNALALAYATPVLAV
jgi:hypothetical protein